MVRTSRVQPHAKAYTIIESLVVLAILVVITMVLIALFIHHKKAGPSDGETYTPPYSLPADKTPAEPKSSDEIDNKTE